MKIIFLNKKGDQWPPFNIEMIHQLFLKLSLPGEKGLPEPS
jgi:hypothetical protein